MKVKILFILILSQMSFSSCKKEYKQVAKSHFEISDVMLKSISLTKVTRMNLKSELMFYGKITADNNKLIEIYPAVGGNVIKVYVELGDYVKKGQLLATIRSAQVAGFEKDLCNAENDVQVAKNNLKATQEMFDSKLNTERDVLLAHSELNKSIAELNREKENYRIFHLKEGAIYEVRSPMNGFILEKKINQDMMLRDDHTNNIFDIAEIDNVWAIANVNESDIANVDLGSQADVSTLGYQGKIFRGKVDKIFNFIDSETKSMKVRISLANPDYLLKPEMKAIIRIKKNEGPKLLVIPNTSIIFDKNKDFVLVFMNKNNIETREINVVRQVGGDAFIDHGVKEGENIVTNNQLQLYDALND